VTPDDHTPLADLPLLAVDLETSGLSPERERVLAVGFVPVDGSRISFSGARRLVVRDDAGPGDAVTIHRLTHDDLASGVPLGEALAELRTALAGRALLAHHVAFDLAFLRAAFRSVGEEPPALRVVCTLDLQRRLLARRGEELAPGVLRLWRARRRFGLAAAPAHDALGDALACAELYLAQVAELDPTGRLTLRHVRRHDTRLRTAWRRWRGRVRLRWRRRRGPGRTVSASSR